MSKLIQQYLDRLLSEYHYLDFRGIMQLEKVVALELDEVFVPLRALPLERPIDEKLESLRDLLKADPERAGEMPDAERLARAGKGPEAERELELAIAGRRSGEPKQIADLLRQCRQLVLLGDPGGGKTTLVKWLARSYALGPDAVKERLGLDEDLVPVVVPIAAFADALQNSDDPEFSLLDYIEQFHNDRTLSLGTALRKKIDDGGAAVLCDGLDEVVDVKLRMSVAGAVHAAIRSWAIGRGCRCVVTSRIYGYEICRIRDVAHWQLAPFEEKQIKKFVQGWSWGLERALHPKAPRQKAADDEAADLTRAVFAPGAANTSTLQTFAENPLLLTILALVKRQYGVLPDLRAQLYNVALKTLVGTWNKARGLAGPIQGIELPTEETIRLWEPVALWMHQQNTGTVQRRDITQRLAEQLVATHAMPAETAIRTAESYLDTAAQWAGLLIERGPHVFGFLHQTFQEYLAARALVRSASDLYAALEPYFFRPRWREVVLLAAGYVGAVQERTEDATRLVDAIRDTEDRLEPYLRRYRVLAATILADRVPVAPRCVDDTLLLLVRSLDFVEIRDEFIRAIASLALLRFSPRAVREAARRFEALKGSDWRIRAALVALTVGSPQKGDGLLKCGLNDPDSDVQALAAALSIRAGRMGPDIAAKLEGIWSASRIPPLDGLARNAIQTAVLVPEVQATLVTLLSAEPAEARCHPAETLLAAGRFCEEAERALVGLLSHETPGVRLRAAEALRNSVRVSEGAERALAGLLADESAGVRWRAAKAFLAAGRFSDGAEQVLVGLLADGSAKTRLRAAGALRSFGRVSEEAGRALVGALADGSSQVRLSAACGLLATGRYHEDGERALVGLLSDPSEHVRLRAANSLRTAARFGNEAEQTLLAMLLSEASQVRLGAAEALRAADRFSEEAERALVALLEDESAWVRWHAAETLRAAGRFSAEAERTLLGLLADRSAWVRWHAAETFRTSGRLSPEAEHTLLGLLADESAEVRLRAAETLGRIDSQRLEEGKPAPDWLDTRYPAAEAPAAVTFVVELPSRGEPTLAEVLNESLTAEPEQRAAAIAQLKTMLHVGGEAGNPQDLDRSVIDAVLDAVKSYPRPAELSAGNQKHAEARQTIVSAVAGRLEQLAGRRAQKDRRAAREELELIRALPDVLCVNVLDQALDQLAAKARDLARQRVVDLAFEPEGPEAGRAVGLYSTLAKSADPASFQVMHRRVAQAALAASPAVRQAALQCLVTFLPKLAGRDRQRAFQEVLSAASHDDEDQTVRSAAAWALRMASHDLTPAEEAAVEQAGVPPLCDLQ